MTIRNEICGASLLAMGLALSSPALAQAEQQEDAALGEIVVTATRQSELLSRVPISVSAFDQERLDSKGVKSIQDIVRFTPGINVDASDNKIAIRGISSNAGAGTTGIYIDETPIQTRALRGYQDVDAVPAVFDLERVEVLRGPQGTLFGAGSEGGTVRYITPQPSFGDYKVYARAEIAAVEHGGISHEFGAAVGGPIVEDKIAFRVSGYRSRQAGFIDQTSYQTGEVIAKNANSIETTALAGALSFKPSDALTLTFNARMQDRTVNADGTFTIGGGGNAPRFQFPTFSRQEAPDKFQLYSLNAKYELDAVDIVSATSYYRRRNTGVYDGGYASFDFHSAYVDPASPYSPLLTPSGPNSNLPIYGAYGVVPLRQDNFTQELRVQSSNSNAPVSFVAGVFYTHAKSASEETFFDPSGEILYDALYGISFEDFFGAPMLPNSVVFYSLTKGYDKQFAGFADVTVKITDKLKLNAGARYSSAKYAFSLFGDGPFNGGTTSSRGSGKEDPFTNKLNLSYNFNPDTMVYATRSTGFRVGGVNSPLPRTTCGGDLAALGITVDPTGYKSDTVTNWEIGAKGRVAGVFSAAASAYQIDWKDIQQSTFLPTCQVSFTSNLGEAKVKGFDLQMNVSPVHNLNFDMALGYTHARYTKSLPAGALFLVQKGDAIEGAPWRVSVGGQYDFELDDKTLYLRADYQYSSRLRAFTPSTNPGNFSYSPTNRTADATHFVGVRAGVETHGVNASLFVDNLFDSRPITDYSDYGINHEYRYGRAALRPRTFGLTISYRR